MGQAMTNVIGSVAYPDGGPVATLHVDGSWSVPGFEWAESVLKLAYSDAYEGPSAGPFGPAILHELAEAVGGVATIVPREAPEGDDIRY